MDWNVNFQTLLAMKPSAATAAGQTVTTPIDLTDIHGSGQTNAVFGCNCSTNPSGLSEAEKQAAWAQNGG